MSRLLPLLCTLLALQACRLNPECFRSDECDPGFICQQSACVAGHPDAAEDAGSDAGPQDREPADMSPADGTPSDMDPSDRQPTDVDADGGADGGTDGGMADAAGLHWQSSCRGPGIVGNPLPDGRSSLEYGQNDYLLLHFDTADPAVNGSRAAMASISCNGDCAPIDCQVYDGALAAGSTVTVSYNQTNQLIASVGEYRFEAWVRWNGQAGCILSAEDDAMSPNDLSWSVCVNADGVVSPAPNNQTSATVELAMGAWTHLGVFFTQTDAFVQLDGVDAGRYANPASATGTGVGLIRIDSSPADLDEVRFGEANTGLYLTSKDYPRLCAAFQGPNDQLFVADELLEHPRQLRGAGRLPRLSPDLERVAFVSCNGTCDIVEEVLADGSQSTLVSDVSATLAPAYGPSREMFYVPAGSPRELRGLASAPPKIQPHDAEADIDAFDVTLVQEGGGLLLPTALIATSSSIRPRIEIIEYRAGAPSTFETPVWRGEAGERVIWLRFAGVGPEAARFNDQGNYQGFWVARVNGAGGDRLVYGNRNSCVDVTECGSSAAFSVEPALHPLGSQVLGFSPAGALLLESEQPTPATLSPGGAGRGQLDLRWTY